MKVLVIYNPVAGKVNRAEWSIKRGLAGVDYDWVKTNREGTYLDNIDGSRYDRVIVAGGDGTVSHVANWILKNNHGLVLGIVPQGSANLLALSFGLPRNPGFATKMALSGESKAIDVGLVNKEKYFLIAAGLGYDAWVIKNTKRVWKRLFGFGAYTMSMLQGLINIREYNFDLIIDGQRRQHHAKTLFIMNFGKFLGFSLGPDISYDDGYLSLAVVRPVKLSDYFKMLGRLIGRKFQWQKRLEYYKFKRLQINYNKKIWSQLDGESWRAGSPLEIEVVEKKLKIVSK